MSAFKKNNGHEPVVNSRLILLAEDHPLNQKVALLLLERMGFESHVVSNGVQAVEAALHNHYDAILMDCHMPEMDGFDATREIRRNEQGTGKHVPIIAVTALAMAGDRERCLAAGMDDYITKPIDRDLLHHKLVYWMNPGTISAITNPGNVVAIFDSAFATTHEIKDEPLSIAHFYDSYGDEAPELLLLFVHSSERIVESLKDAIQDEEQTNVGRLAHELKGASWAVGADELARLSVFLEQAAGQGNWRLMHRTYIRLHHHFEEVKKFVQRTIQPESSTAQI
jgi:two-component system sensor histidine kinase/response regulator